LQTLLSSLLRKITPDGADKFVYNLPPIIALATVLVLWAVLPLAPTIFATDINVGVLFIVAMGSISTLGIIMAGWASNNKYALLGAFRTVAQMVSYEVPMVISLLIPVILAGSMGINTIVKAQSIPYILIAPLAALLFFLSAQAELGRAPFDLNEAESEIVAGFHIEYTGMKFGMFYAGELLHALTVGGLFSAFFLGGWRGPFVDAVPLLGLVYFFIKAFFMYWVIMWLKYSMPRIRIDHMLNLNWKLLTPLSLVVLVVTAILEKLLTGSPLWLYWLVNLGANFIILWVTLSIVRRFFKVERKRVAEPRPYARPPAARQPAAAPGPEAQALQGQAPAQPSASSPTH
jgi:NADH-quinone oxidoreductase subunit H